MQNNALTTIPGSNCVLLDVEAQLPDAMTYGEWETAVKGIQFIDKRSKFWLGDLIMAGEERFGEMYAQALDHTTYALKTLKNIVYTCKNVDPTIRRLDGCLEFGHNTEVAKLLPDEQIQWLRDAFDNEWSVQELREAIKVSRGEGGGEQEGKPDPSNALREISAVANKFKFTAIPSKQEIEKMILCIQTIQKICKEHGV
jgi:hypothetical protein